MEDETTDPILGAFLRAQDIDTARRELDGVIEGVARPVVRAIVRASFRWSAAGSPPVDVDDVEQTALTSLTASLLRLRGPDAPAAIQSLPDYAATVAYNTCHAVLRLRAPGRARLRAHVRYVLAHDPAFDVVDGPGHRKLAALKSSGARQPPAPAEALDAALARIACPPGWPRLGGPVLARLLRTVLEGIDGPCFLEVLVDRLAAAFGGLDVDRAADSRTEPEAHTPSPIEVLDYRERLARLWCEIRALPLRQRAALLFNLRDENGFGAIELLPATGVASVLEIARALDLSEAELSHLWPTLPRDDHWIAERLGLTRRQVINLRKCARERLFRRSRLSAGSTAARTRSVHPEDDVREGEGTPRLQIGEPEA